MIIIGICMETEVSSFLPTGVSALVDGRKPNILVVDDNTANLLLTGEMRNFSITRGKVLRNRLGSGAVFPLLRPSLAHVRGKTAPDPKLPSAGYPGLLRSY